MISNVCIENFTCYPVILRPDGFGGTKTMPHVALRLESNMDHFRISNFRYAANAEEVNRCPAVIATNLCGEKILADGKEYTLTQKIDTVVIDTFKDICIDLIPDFPHSDANQR